MLEHIVEVGIRSFIVQHVKTQHESVPASIRVTPA